MDMVSFMIGFIAACVLLLIVSTAYHQGKAQARLEKMQGEHEEQKERVQQKLK